MFGYVCTLKMYTSANTTQLMRKKSLHEACFRLQTEYNILFSNVLRFGVETSFTNSAFDLGWVKLHVFHKQMHSVNKFPPFSCCIHFVHICTSSHSKPKHQHICVIFAIRLDLTCFHNVCSHPTTTR